MTPSLFKNQPIFKPNPFVLRENQTDLFYIVAKLVINYKYAS